MSHSNEEDYENLFQTGATVNQNKTAVRTLYRLHWVKVTIVLRRR